MVAKKSGKKGGGKAGKAAGIGSQGLTHRQANLVKILADPGQADQSAAAIAQQVGVSPRTVARWRNLPVVQEAIRRSLDRSLAALRPYALQCLRERMQKDTQALKLFYELDQQLVQRYELSGPGGGPVRLAALATYSEAELQAMREELQMQAGGSGAGGGGDVALPGGRDGRLPLGEAPRVIDVEAEPAGDEDGMGDEG